MKRTLNKLYQPKRRRFKLLPRLLFMLMALTGSFSTAIAQRANQSDWNVPPPLAPGNITKGDAEGKSSGSNKAVLTLTDVAATSQPDAAAIELDLLAAISTISPQVTTPGQPTIAGYTGGEVPMPGAPETPELPKQTPQDAVITQATELPMPDEPEMPDFPTEPAATAQGNTSKGMLPLLPEVGSSPGLSLPKSDVINSWPVPGIPESVNLKAGK
ncbi:MAG: hypothetical protein EOP46_14355 [Sphingobacteriaceae bacterium]|nr:MAG: hypothetical protein EOP46_14355 [Sphingobacteriaceae bacterium]